MLRDGRREGRRRDPGRGNVDASPLRYALDPADQLAIDHEIEDDGWELGAIYHSHTRTEPVPSQTDINLALVDGSDRP